MRDRCKRLRAVLYKAMNTIFHSVERALHLYNLSGAVFRQRHPSAISIAISRCRQLLKRDVDVAEYKNGDNDDAGEY